MKRLVSQAANRKDLLTSDWLEFSKGRSALERSQRRQDCGRSFQQSLSAERVILHLLPTLPHLKQALRR